MAVDGVAEPEVYEIRIKRVAELSDEAQLEVKNKLNKLPREFGFRGYAKVIYTKASPLSIAGVDPIEGTIIDYFRQLMVTK